MRVQIPPRPPELQIPRPPDKPSHRLLRIINLWRLRIEIKWREW